MSSSMETEESTDAALLLDRFVSASTSEDVNSSLTSILRGLQKGKIEPYEVYNEIEVLSALLQVLQTNQYKDLPVEDSAGVAARIYLELLNKSNKDGINTLLQEPSSGRLIETSIDVASNNEYLAGIYPRVVCLQVLNAICTKGPKLAQQQLMQAPNGLHRLGDLLRPDVPEQVRNEALSLASTIAEWPSAAKVWMYNEVGDIVIQTAIQEGGLTGGNVLVLDCLKLLKNLLKHDAALAGLVFESATIAPSLARLLDLRGGYAFRNPTQVEPPITVEDDDLDDLIASGGKKNKDTDKNKSNNVKVVVIPYLTQAEESIVEAVFDILGIALEDQTVKSRVWKKHLPLASLIWEMALISPPPPGAAYPCGVPSINLQQRALQITALYFSVPDIMDRHTGLDRLLFVVCTGGRGQTIQERMQLQQSALHVIRQTLSSKMASQMLLYAQAPMMFEDDVANNPDPSHIPPPVIKKLLNTAYENLNVHNEENSSITPKPPSLSRKIFLSGSLGGLALFCTDEASRSILFRITQATDTKNGEAKVVTSLVDAVLECLMVEAERTTNIDDDFISLHLIRFLLSWIYEAPIVVQAILSSPHAATLSLVFYNSMSSSSDKSVAMGALINCLLGMCMEYMGDESKCGGWTISSIMEMISSKRGGGVSRFTARLEKLKSLDHHLLPWSTCSLEWKIWNQWYDKIVLIVRKRVVQELTGGSGGDDQLSDDEHEVQTDVVTSPMKGQKSLQRLLSQQSSEIDDLRELLAKSKLLNASQEKQLASWKQRAESTPNQLDEMLTELTTKTVELEEKNGLLLEEMAKKKESNKTILNERNDKVDEISKELIESKAREEEMREELNTLREEMAGINHAYMSLEEEYRRQQTETSTHVSQISETSDALQEQQDGQSQVGSHTLGSTEVSTLRAENTRLQSSLQEADVWIATAVQRIDGLQSEVVTLQQKIDILQTHIEDKGTTELATYQEMLNQERFICSQVEETLSTAVGNLHDMQEELDAKSNQQTLVDIKIAELTTEKEMLLLRVQELEMHSQDEKMEVKDSEDVSTGSNQGIEKRSTSGQVDELQQVVAKLSNEIQNLQSLINDRDMIIDSLESQINDQGPNNGIGDEIRIRDDEIANLRHSNDEAQNWINLAVQHQQVLSDNLAQAMDERSRLQEQLESLTNERWAADESRNVVPDNDKLVQLTSQLKVLERELSKKQDELQTMQVELIEKEKQIQSLGNRQKTTETLDFSGNESELHEKIQNLEAQLTDQEEEHSSVIKEWEAAYAAIELEKAKFASDSQTAYSEREELREALLDCKNHIEEISQGFFVPKEDSTLEPESNSITEGEHNKPTTEDVVGTLKLALENITVQLKDNDRETNEVVSMWQQSYSALEAHVSALEQDLAEAKAAGTSQNQTIVDERTVEMLNEELGSNSFETNDLQEKHYILELQFAELLSEKEKLLESLKCLQDELEHLRHRQLDGEETVESFVMVEKLAKASSDSKECEAKTIETMERELAEITQEAQETVELWQSRCAEIELQANDHLEQVTLWQNRCSELEIRVGELLELKATLSPSSQNDLSRDTPRTDTLFSNTTNFDENFDIGNGEVLQLRADNELLCNEINSLNSKHEGDMKEFNEIVNQWQSSYDNVVWHLEHLTKENSQSSIALKNLLEKIDGPTLENFSPQSNEDVDTQVNIVEVDKSVYYEAAEADVDERDLDKTVYYDVNTDDATKLIGLLSGRWDALLVRIEDAENQTRMLSTDLEQTKDLLAAANKMIDDLMRPRANGTIDEGQVEELQATLNDYYHQLENKNLLLSEIEANFEKIVCERDIRIKSLTEEKEQSDQAAHAWKNRAEQLEADINVMEGHLHDQKSSYELSIEQWQQSYNDLEARYDEVTDTKEELRVELRELKSDPSSNLTKSQEMTDALEGPTKVVSAQEWNDLQQRVIYLQGKSEHEVQSWQEACRNLEMQIENMQFEQEQNFGKLQKYRDLVKPLLGDVFTSDVSSETGVRQPFHFDDDAYSFLTRFSPLLHDGQLQSPDGSKFQDDSSYDENGRKNSTIVDSPNQQDLAYQKLEEEMAALRAENQSLEEQLAEADDIVQQWQRSHELLMSEIESLRSDKEELAKKIDHMQTETSDSPTAHLESRISAHMDTAFRLEKELDAAKGQNKLLQERIEFVLKQELENDVTKRELECEQNSRRNAESRCAFLEKEIANTKDTCITRVETVVAEKDRIISSLERDNLTCAGRLNRIEIDLNDLQTIKDQLEEENIRLKDQISMLVQELQEASNSMQMFITNTTNDKASHVASEVLRQQLDDVLHEVESYKHTISVESGKRQSLEKEVKSLKMDLSAILGLEYNETNHPEIQRRTMEAVECLQQIERAELQSLKETLEHSMEELANSRKVQTDLEEQLSKARHEVIILQQKVIESKNEFLSLTKSFDDIRSSESSRRASFEYRIVSLENDTKVKRLRHASELESLRNDLNQASLERDQLFQSLKESEKRNETLPCNSSENATIDVEIELRKIQKEKALLLLSISEEASKLERRLREAREAEKAYVESDVILERELRFAAENALENLRKDFNEQKVDSSKNVSKDEKIDLNKKLQNDLNKTLETVEELTSENFSLRDRLETCTKEAQASIDRLQSEVQQAKRRVIHYETAGHFEAEVQVEQARRNNSSKSGYHTRISLPSTFDGEETKENLAVSKLYDLIKKQSEAIEEERSVYTEIANKNDELLALLAQFDILKNVLQTALVNHAGYHAVEAAVREAEEKAEADFGRAVRFV